MNNQDMTPSRPFLLRAFYDWILDNDLTPHLLVNTELKHVQVPVEFAKDGQIVLNIAPRAVVGFSMDNEAVCFNARFGGIPHQVYVPMAAVIAIQARENGAGTFFPPEPAYEAWELDNDSLTPLTEAPLVDTADEGSPKEAQNVKGRSHLRVIK